MAVIDFSCYIPPDIRNLDLSQNDIPRIAKDQNIIRQIESGIAQIHTTHQLYQADARNVPLKPESIHLVVTSPPYWTLKEYPKVDGQLGSIADYEAFLRELDKVWQSCYSALVPGGRLVCVVGDVCLSRRENDGRHSVVPLHASLQEHFRRIGFANLAPIIWYKITNARYETNHGSTFLGKPYEPNGIVKNDIEFILMQRKPGGYRKVSDEARILSVISEKNHRGWFQQIWSDIPGASTKLHPAPFPLQLAERLIRMFSFVGDVVADPFMGTGTTDVAAAKWGRNSIGVEIDQNYFAITLKRLGAENYFNRIAIEIKT